MDKSPDVKQKCYLYAIVNKTDGKIYIGQTINVPRRWIEHSSSWDSRKSTPIQLAITDQGKDNFHFDIIGECKDRAEATIYEQRLIVHFETLTSQNGYNVRPATDTGPRSPESIEQGRFARIKDSPERQQAIITDYKANMPVKEIMTKYGIPGATRVYRILERNGIEKSGNFDTFRGRIHSPGTKAKMAAKATSLWSSGERAENSTLTILTEEQKEEVRQKHASGKRIKELTEEYSCSPKTISKAINYQ